MNSNKLQVWHLLKRRPSYQRDENAFIQTHRSNAHTANWIFIGYNYIIQYLPVVWRESARAIHSISIKPDELNWSKPIVIDCMGSLESKWTELSLAFSLSLSLCITQYVPCTQVLWWMTFSFHIIQIHMSARLHIKAMSFIEPHYVLENWNSIGIWNTINTISGHLIDWLFSPIRIHCVHFNRLLLTVRIQCTRLEHIKRSAYTGSSTYPSKSSCLCK